MKHLGIGFLIFSLFACNEPNKKATDCDQNFDYIPSKSIAYDSLNSEKSIELGRLLFFEKALSKDSSISCGSCHQPQFAFADNKAISPGIEGRLGFRNAPSIANVKFQTLFFHDGGGKSLEMQIQGPFDNETEFDLNIVEGFDRIAQSSFYQQKFVEAFGSKPTMYLFTRAIALFENSLISGNSKWDQFYYRGDSAALTQSELNGWKLFQSPEVGCISCHNGFNFTSYEFENIGFANLTGDIGRMRITGDSLDKGKIKVPSLRNLGFTSPYMHNGALSTLDDVVDYYASFDSSEPNLSPLLKKISLSDSEKLDLIHFLQALNDTSFVKCHISKE